MSGKMKDISGQHFGRLTAISATNERYHNGVVWSCQCSCGKLVEVPSNRLVSAKTSSCGCLHRERAIQANTTHGYWGSPTYHSWSGMISRCTNLKHKNYKYYGGRGITVADAWLTSFENFLRDMGERPPGTTIDRIDNDGDYIASNCRWASRKTQASNRRKKQRRKKP